MQPLPYERICLISYEVAQLRLGGGPKERPGFWKAYREEMAHNAATEFQNYRVRVCQHHIRSLKKQPKTPVYFRAGKLFTEDQKGALMLKEIE